MAVAMQNNQRVVMSVEDTDILPIDLNLDDIIAKQSPQPNTSSLEKDISGSEIFFDFSEDLLNDVITSSTNSTKSSVALSDIPTNPPTLAETITIYSPKTPTDTTIIATQIPRRLAWFEQPPQGNTRSNSSNPSTFETVADNLAVDTMFDQTAIHPKVTIYQPKRQNTFSEPNLAEPKLNIDAITPPRKLAWFERPPQSANTLRPTTANRLENNEVTEITDTVAKQPVLVSKKSQSVTDSLPTLPISPTSIPSTLSSQTMLPPEALSNSTSSSNNFYNRDNFLNHMDAQSRYNAIVKSPVSNNVALEEPLTLSRRLMDMLLVGLGFALFGVVIDWVVNLVKSLNGNTGETVWFFVYFMGILGAILGFAIGTKAFDVVFGLFRTTPAENNPNSEDNSFSGGLMKAIGFGLLIGILGWLLMMMLV